MKFPEKHKNSPILTRENANIQPGEFFVTWNDSIFNNLISFVQGFRSSDRKGKFGHAGFFVDNRGKSFEALWKIKEYDFFDKHDGQFVIIGRHEAMSENLFRQNYKRIYDRYNDKIYYVYRLIFHISQMTSAITPFDGGVCSEITARFFYYCDFWSWYRGATPDNIKDWMCDWWNDWVDVRAGWVNRNPYK